MPEPRPDPSEEAHDDAPPLGEADPDDAPSDAPPDLEAPPREELADETGVVGRRPLPDIFSTDNIFERVCRVARHEIDEGREELIWAGLAAGFCICLSYLGLIHLGVFAGPDNRVITALLYPLGFLFIVLGRYQLYTENTLTPVVLVLTRQVSIPDLLRLWGIVLATNLLGAALGAMALAWTGILGSEAHESARAIAEHAMSHGPVTAFWKAVIAGWLVAGMTWIVHAVTSTTGRILVIWLFLYAVGAFDLVHCIAGAAEAVYAVLMGVATVPEVLGSYLLPAILGNTVGGVVLVAVLNYAQTREQRHALGEQLTWREMLFGTSR
jgi:formate-nitrite transporter family protein